MAPEVALDKIDTLTRPGDVVLDPMCGSGTVPRLAGEHGRRAIACDVDPLAVMIARTACKPAWSGGLARRAKVLLREARSRDDSLPRWIAMDPSTREFVDYWFAPRQLSALSRIAKILATRPQSDDPLRVALSRLIITKEVRASLARDTAHSRPHRVQDDNEFDVDEAFVKAAARVESAVTGYVPAYQPSIRTSDARALSFVARSSVDLVVTSPPYLNAIDYLRGHRLSLVWFGFQVEPLRTLRSESIGAERILATIPNAVWDATRGALPRLNQLADRDQGMVFRYARDLHRLCRSLARVVRPGGGLVFVMGDSLLHGVPVANSALSRAIAESHGFIFQESVLRPLAERHRYLPPPTASRSTLKARMREECVLMFERAA
jgi:SAM-dependent methyltransferase